MNTHKDLEEFLRLCAKHEVDFVVVGGYAVAFHGYVRATQDMDLFFRNSEANIPRLVQALREFGMDIKESQISAFSDPSSIIQMGNPPARIEMICGISGLSFDEVWQHRVQGKFGDLIVSFISFKHLVRNKLASGRPKDLADVDELGALDPDKEQNP